MAFPRIFSPLTLRHKTLRNRIVFGAHTANMAVNGLPVEQHAAYYRERAIGGDHPCFVIAEIGSNHDGSLDRAKALVDAVAEAGADAVKLQSFTAGGMILSMPSCISSRTTSGKDVANRSPAMRKSGGRPTLRCRSDPSSETSFSRSSSRLVVGSVTFYSRNTYLVLNRYRTRNPSP